MNGQLPNFTPSRRAWTTPSKLVSVPPSALVASPLNVGRYGCGPIKELAGLIDSQGLLHNLVRRRLVVHLDLVDPT